MFSKLLQMSKNPRGFCLCGCGHRTALSSETRRGYKRGEPMMYIRGHQQKPIVYQIDKITDCWNWKRPLNSYGYGRVTRHGKTIGAHQYFYSLYQGEIPNGCEVHHLCGNTKCVNPKHLTAVTRREHMATDGRSPFGNKKAKVRFDQDVYKATE